MREVRPPMNEKLISFQLNGESVVVAVPPNETLLDTLRERLHVTSPKKTCERGECGACTVILDGVAVNACLVLTVSIRGKSVITVEGIGSPEKLHPLQEAFLRLGAVQCGYCTPGMILSAKAFLDQHPDPTYEQVAEALSGNLCRCTGYVKPIEAVLEAARIMREVGTRGEAEPAWTPTR